MGGLFWVVLFFEALVGTEMGGKKFVHCVATNFAEEERHVEVVVGVKGGHVG